MEDLSRFRFPLHVEMFGSYGLERGPLPRTAVVGGAAPLDQLQGLADDTANRAGEGAWVEKKRAGVVLHVREAADGNKAPVTDGLLRAAELVVGAHVKVGHDVVELLARSTSKANAIATLRAELDSSTVMFVGDDHTDEEVFRSLGPGDCGVRVGHGDTAARYRLVDPQAVVSFLRSLPAAWNPADAHA